MKQNFENTKKNDKEQKLFSSNIFQYELISELKNNFEEYSRSKNMFEETPVPLISSGNDPTVIFTGSSSNVFKKYLTGEKKKIPQNGTFLYQKKIRTQNYNTFFDETKRPIFCSYFEGGGSLFPPDKYLESINYVIDFITIKLDFPIERLKIRSSHQNSDMNLYFNNEKFQPLVEYDEYDQKDYNWEFGEDSLKGTGIIFSVKQSDNNYKDIGTLVKIKNLNGDNIAVEWGFGAETFLSRAYNIQHPIGVSAISNIFSECANSTENIKLADAITTALAILNEGILYNKKDQTAASTVLIRYMKGVVYYMRELDISLQTVETWARYLEKEHFKNSECANKLLSYLENKINTEKILVKSLELAIKGDTRDIIKLQGVRSEIEKNGYVDIIKLFSNYGFTNLETSKFYQNIKENLLENKFLKI